jgi:hypothetical protein
VAPDHLYTTKETRQARMHDRAEVPYLNIPCSTILGHCQPPIKIATEIMSTLQPRRSVGHVPGHSCSLVRPGFRTWNNPKRRESFKFKLEIKMYRETDT